MAKWIKIPGPGQDNGLGNWFMVSGGMPEKFYNECLKTGYLPTYEGNRPPKEEVKENQENVEVAIDRVI